MTGGLSVTATLSAQIHTAPGSDWQMDPYIANRAPFAGDFVNRLLARWPYWVGLPVRLKQGYIGLDYSLWRTTHYVLDSVTRPNQAATAG